MIRVIVKSQGTKLRLVTRDGPPPSLTTPPPGASRSWGTPKWGRAAVTSCTRTLQHQAAMGKTPTATWKSTPPSCSATSRCPAPPVGRSRQRCGPPLAPATTQKWGTTGTAAPQFCTRYDDPPIKSRHILQKAQVTANKMVEEVVFWTGFSLPFMWCRPFCCKFKLQKQPSDRLKYFYSHSDAPFERLLKLTLATKLHTPCERARKTESEKMFSFVVYHFLGHYIVLKDVHHFLKKSCFYTGYD